MGSIRRSVALVVIAASASGCKGGGRERDADATAVRIAKPVARPFSETFDLRRTIVLEQPDSAPIARLSGIDRSEAGRLLVGDVSEGNVKLFDHAGRLLRIVGRQGEGPGEFTAPRFPRFGPGGRIYVADAQNPRIQVFDSAGTFLRGIRLDFAGGVEGFEPRADGTFLLAVHREESEAVLVEVDSTGRARREFLRIGAVRPQGEPDHPLWRNVRSSFVTVRGDTAFVTSTLSDSLWMVDLASGRESRIQLVLPAEYVRPAPPRAMPADIPSLLAWSNGFHTASVVSAAPSALSIPFVRGVLNNGDPLLLVTRDGAGEWHVSPDAPPVIGGGAEGLIAIMNPGEANVKLGIYAPRR